MYVIILYIIYLSLYCHKWLLSTTTVPNGISTHNFINIFYTYKMKKTPQQINIWYMVLMKDSTIFGSCGNV